MAFTGDELLNDEQSGWTSYLDTTSSTPHCYNSESLFCSTFSVFENISSMLANSVGDIAEESHGSTVSDASSGRASRPERSKNCGATSNSEKCMTLQQRTMGHHENYRQFGAQFDLIRAQLEDTATSSPISTEQQYKAHEDVTEKFRVLETLIPHLKEVAVHANEEDILNAIIDHVHALEIKVELLSKMSGIYRH